MKFLMCSPEYYGIYYEINPWMHIDKPVILDLAKQQWKNLYQTILKTGSDVLLIKPVSGLPDMVFTANAGLLYNKQVWISHFLSHERQNESLHFRECFNNHGLEIVNMDLDMTKPPSFEGAGDALFLGEKLIAGYGFRSQSEIYEHSFFQQFKPVLCELVDPYFYHLDTCFCPITPTLAMWYPGAFSSAAQQKLNNICELIDVTYDEAKHFACNAIVIGEEIILPSGCPKLTTKLEKLGYLIHVCDMSEYIKAGGACKCLTLCI